MPRRTAVTEQRIAHIAAMMRRLEWRTGESGPALAREWRLSKSSLEKLAAEASRRVRAEIADPAVVTFTVCAALETTLRAALADGDRRSVVRAAAVWSRVARPSEVPTPLEADPRIAGMYQAILASLEDFDRLRAAFVAEVGTMTGGALPSAALPSAFEHVRAAVRRYEAEISRSGSPRARAGSPAVRLGS